MEQEEQQEQQQDFINQTQPQQEQVQQEPLAQEQLSQEQVRQQSEQPRENSVPPLPQEYFDKVKEGDDLFYEKKYEEALEKFLSIQSYVNENYPNDMGLLNNCIANCYYNLGRNEEALPHYEITIKCLPQYADVDFMLGFLYFKKDMEKSIKYYYDGLKLKPDLNQFTFLAMAMIKSHLFSQKDLKETFERNIDILRPQLMKGKPAFTYNNKDYDKNKRLKIGYFSSDFYCHAMMSFVLPIIENHNLDEFDLVFYGCNEKKDHVTDRIKKIGGEYVDCSQMDYTQIADKIHEDKVDILVDLGGYTHKKVLWTLLYKPAPVIIQYLGYLGTYGIKEVDYILTDEFTVPPEIAPYYTEKPLYIGCGMNKFTFQSENVQHALVTPLPYDNNGYITFGSYNCRSKINSYTIKLWSKALNAVPNSKILMFRTNFEKEDFERLTRQFAENGVTSDRIIFDTKLPPTHVDCYSRSDIALDPSPFSGLTITIEQAYMGLPTLTMPSETISSKGAARVNLALGLNEFIADNEEDFAAKAKAITDDIQKLRYYRANLRRILKESYLYGDFRPYVEHIEQAYKRAWSEFCEKESQ